MKKELYSILILFLISSVVVFGQTGVQTKQSQGVLHIDGQKDNSGVPTQNQRKNDVVFTEDGYLGVGILNPDTRVDIRSGEQTSIVGIGQTSRTAVEVGAGVLRYNEVDDMMEYSDGLNWYPLSDMPPPKAVVVATKTSTQTFANNSGTTITNFNTVEDNYNAFNNSSGVFTAPREGYYYVSLNYTLSSGVVNNNSYIESVIVSSNSQNNIKEYRGLNSFPGFHATYDPQIEVAGNATALFYLKEGDTVHFSIYHTLGGPKTNTGNANENRISIIEI